MVVSSLSITRRVRDRTSFRFNAEIDREINIPVKVTDFRLPVLRPLELYIISRNIIGDYITGTIKGVRKSGELEKSCDCNFWNKKTRINYLIHSSVLILTVFRLAALPAV